MATKKSAQSQSNENGSKRRSGGKKRGARKRGGGKQRSRQVNPPILVGGGSSLVWLPKDLTTQIDPPPASNYVAVPEQYLCFEVDFDIVTVNVKDGVDPNPKKVKTKHKKNHHTVFTDF